MEEIHGGELGGGELDECDRWGGGGKCYNMKGACACAVVGREGYTDIIGGVGTKNTIRMGEEKWRYDQ